MAASGEDQTTVTCITGNGLKTTDAITNSFTHLDARAIRPRLADFATYLRELDGITESELAIAGAK